MTTKQIELGELQVMKAFAFNVITMAHESPDVSHNKS